MQLPEEIVEELSKELLEELLQELSKEFPEGFLTELGRTPSRTFVGTVKKNSYKNFY